MLLHYCRQVSIIHHCHLRGALVRWHEKYLLHVLHCRSESVVSESSVPLCCSLVCVNSLYIFESSTISMCSFNALGKQLGVTMWLQLHIYRLNHVLQKPKSNVWRMEIKKIKKHEKKCYKIAVEIILWYVFACVIWSDASGWLCSSFLLTSKLPHNAFWSNSTGCLYRWMFHILGLHPGSPRGHCLAAVVSHSDPNRTYLVIILVNK